MQIPALLKVSILFFMKAIITSCTTNDPNAIRHAEKMNPWPHQTVLNHIRIERNLDSPFIITTIMTRSITESPSNITTNNTTNMKNDSTNDDTSTNYIIFGVISGTIAILVFAIIFVVCFRKWLRKKFRAKKSLTGNTNNPQLDNYAYSFQNPNNPHIITYNTLDNHNNLNPNLGNINSLPLFERQDDIRDDKILLELAIAENLDANIEKRVYDNNIATAIAESEVEVGGRVIIERNEYPRANRIDMESNNNGTNRDVALNRPNGNVAYPSSAPINNLSSNIYPRAEEDLQQAIYENYLLNNLQNSNEENTRLNSISHPSSNNINQYIVVNQNINLGNNSNARHSGLGGHVGSAYDNNNRVDGITYNNQSESPNCLIYEGNMPNRSNRPSQVMSNPVVDNELEDIMMRIAIEESKTIGAQPQIYQLHGENGLGSGASGGGNGSNRGGVGVIESPIEPIEKQKCIICLENDPDVFLAPCLHNEFCNECVMKIMEFQDPKCPLCKNDIQEYRRLNHK